jgi:protein required for attachment to host cells
MHIRVVVADRAEARFYDTDRLDSKLALVGQMTDPEAHLRNRDFKSERPGRVFDHAPSGARRGSVAHHDTGGEREPLKHEAELFARRIVDELEKAHPRDRFDKLVVIAAPEFLGKLREVMPKSLHAVLALEIRKDLVHQDEPAIRTHLPADLFVEPVR